MKIRRMNISDYEGVYKLWISCRGMGLNNIDDSKEGISRFLKRNPNTCFIAVDNEEVIGVIISGNDGRRGYIYHTAVALEYRKQGIASKLLRKALDSLKEEGIIKVALVVFDRNQLGNDFWEKEGFTKREDLIYRNKALTDIIRIDT